MSRTEPFFPFFAALRAGLKGYSAKTLRSDFVAGLTVSLVALPLSMALAIAVGLPPQNGLYTAIVAGALAALLGGSMVQVTGPTAAFVVIVAPIVSQFGLHGLIWCELMAGILLLAMGLARLGSLIHFVPYPVTTGFTAGIAVTIATLALNDFLGLGIERLSGHYLEKAATIAQSLPGLQVPDLVVGMATLLTIFLFPRLTARIPAPVVGIALGTLLSWLFARSGMPVDTLNSRYSYLSPDGATHAGIPPYPPSFHMLGGEGLFKVPTLAEFHTLLLPAFVIAALGALETLLSATVADSMARTRHNPNAELAGLGVANVVSGLATGIPATGAIARTAANIHAGAKTPIASVVHALFILLYMVTLARYISYIPMAALAALLISVAWRMSHAAQFVRIVRFAPRSDVAVLLTCFALTVLIDMVAGVSVGMIMACLLFMARAADSTHMHISTAEKPDVAHGSLPRDVMVYRVEGPLFFGSVDKVLGGGDFIGAEVRKLVVDLTHVPMIDMSGMVGMKTFLQAAARGGRDILVCGPQAVTGRILRKIAGDPVSAQVRVTATLREALEG
jgi:SulP family sulfate permease